MLLRLIRDYAGRYPGWILGTVVLQLAATMTILLLPALNARIIDGGVSQGRTGVIVSTGLVMLGVTLLQAVTAVAAVYCGARVAMGTGRDLRHAVQRRVARFSGREMDRFGTPSLITRGTNDVQQIQMLTLMGLTMMITAPLMSIGGLAMALRTDPGLSWLVWVAIPLLVVLLLLICLLYTSPSPRDS